MSLELLRAMRVASPERRREIHSQLRARANQTSKVGDWYFVAVGYTLIGEHDAAIPIVERMLDRDPEWDEARLLLGTAYAASVQPDLAAACFEHGVRLGRTPQGREIAAEQLAMLKRYFGDPDAYAARRRDRANQLVLLLARGDAALRDRRTVELRKLLAADPNDVAVLIAFAFGLSIVGAMEETHAACRRLLQLAPNSHVVQWNVAEILRDVDVGQSRASYHRALNLARSDEEREQVLARFHTLGTEQPEQRIFGDLVVVGQLGFGGMGEVLEVRQKDSGEHFALKVVRLRDPQHRAALTQELQVHLDLPPNDRVLALRGVRSLGEDVGILTELVRGSSLADWLEDPSHGYAERMEKVLLFAYGILVIHHAGFAHLDVKPANVLVGERGEVKVADFGLSMSQLDRVSALLGKASQQIPRGTPAYQSPEQALRDPSTARPSDVYSFAVSVLHIFAGDLTWMSGHAAPHLLPEFVKRGTIRVELQALLARCLARAPEDRPGMQEVASALREQYIALGGVAPDIPLEPAARPLHEPNSAESRRAPLDQSDATDIHGPAWWLEQLGDSEGANEMSRAQVVAYLADRGQQTLMLRFFDRAVEFASSAPNQAARSTLAGVLTDAARFHMELGDRSGAIEKCIRAERAAALEWGSVAASYQTGRAKRLRGVLMLAAADNHAAFDAFSAAIAALECVPIDYRATALELGFSLANLSQLWAVAGRRDEALVAGKRALATLARSGHPDELTKLPAIRQIVAAWEQ